MAEMDAISEGNWKDNLDDLLRLFLFHHTVVLPYAREYIPDLQWVPEAMGNTEPYIAYIFSYTYRYSVLYLYNEKEEDNKNV